MAIPAGAQRPFLADASSAESPVLGLLSHHIHARQRSLAIPRPGSGASQPPAGTGDAIHATSPGMGQTVVPQCTVSAVRRQLAPIRASAVVPGAWLNAAGSTARTTLWWSTRPTSAVLGSPIGTIRRRLEPATKPVSAAFRRRPPIRWLQTTGFATRQPIPTDWAIWWGQTIIRSVRPAILGSSVRSVRSVQPIRRCLEPTTATFQRTYIWPDVAGRPVLGQSVRAASSSVHAIRIADPRR